MAAAARREVEVDRGDAEPSLDPLQLYLSAAGRRPLLTARQEQELARAAERGDVQARKILVESSLRRQIGRTLGLTAPRIGQIEARALGRLAQELDPLRRAG